MKISIRGVEDSKDHDKERLVLDVLEDDELGYYAVVDTTYVSEGKISNKSRHFHWFDNQDVKKGDVIVLYTKEGKSHSKKTTTGTIYIRYWNMDNSIWNNDKDYAVLLHMNEWTSKPVK